MPRQQYTLAELADLLVVDCVGDSKRVISGLATLSSATTGQMSFLANSKYQKDLESTKASAVILVKEMAKVCPANCLISDNPYLTYARASQLFAPKGRGERGIHPSAVIDSSAVIHPSASVAANAVIESGVKIGANTIIGAGSVIGFNSSIGDGCQLYANVSVYHDVTIQDRVTLHSGVVIGSDGFGFAPSSDKAGGGWVKIAQLGGVRIGSDVEIGASTTVDRGALDDTVIADRVIIDNQVQIAHNVMLGENTAIAACTAIAGSTRIGKNCTIAGCVGIVGHLNITDDVHITAMSMVTHSIEKPGSYSSGTVVQDTRQWRKNAVRFGQLDTIAKRLQQIEKKLD